MSRLPYLVPLLMLGACVGAQGGSSAPTATARATLQTGDLLFLDLRCPTCSAIEDVTKQQLGVAGPALSHVGLVQVDAQGQAWVIEAWPGPGVTRTPLAAALRRVDGSWEQRNGAYVLRAPAADRALARGAAQRGASLLGTPYDELFLPDTARLYCSELVALAFSRAARGRVVFAPRPMRFGSAGSAARAVWQRYYAERKAPIPEGLPGVSPLGIYLDARRRGWRPPR